MPEEGIIVPVQPFRLQRSSIRAYSFVAIGIVFVAVLILSYFYGFFSFLYRRSYTELCKIKVISSCNGAFFLKRAFSVLNVNDERLGSPHVVSSREVLAFINAGSLWSWSHDGLMRRYIINADTTFGITLSIGGDKSPDGRITLSYRTGLLKPVSLYSEFIKRMTTVAFSGPIQLEVFRGFARPGDLIEPIYNRNTNILLDVGIVDLSRL